MHTAYNPEMALHTTHRTKPAPTSSPTHTPPRQPRLQNSAAPLAAPPSALAAGTVTPQPAALGNYQLRVFPAR